MKVYAPAIFFLPQPTPDTKCICTVQYCLILLEECFRANLGCFYLCELLIVAYVTACLERCLALIPERWGSFRLGLNSRMALLNIFLAQSGNLILVQFLFWPYSTSRQIVHHLGHEDFCNRFYGRLFNHPMVRPPIFGQQRAASGR